MQLRMSGPAAVTTVLSGFDSRAEADFFSHGLGFFVGFKQWN